MKVLEELGADAKKTLTVFNKIDRVEDPMTKAMLRNSHPDALFISVHSGDGLDLLVGKLGELVGNGSREIMLRVPHDRADLLARLHREGVVHETTYEAEFSLIRATLPAKLRQQLAPYVAE
jgi:GTP-binding protein HflX